MILAHTSPSSQCSHFVLAIIVLEQSTAGVSNQKRLLLQKMKHFFYFFDMLQLRIIYNSLILISLFKR